MIDLNIKIYLKLSTCKYIEIQNSWHIFTQIHKHHNNNSTRILNITLFKNLSSTSF